jgi:hypothetical protein
MLVLERRELLHQCVERVVGDLGVVEEVVPVFVAADLVAKGLDSIGGVHEREPRAKTSTPTKPAEGCPGSLVFVTIVVFVPIG